MNWAFRSVKNLFLQHLRLHTICHTKSLVAKKHKVKIINRPNKIGKLFYKGPNIFAGYAYSYKDLVYSKSKTLLDTGDIAKFDNDGNFFISSSTNIE